MGSASAVTSKHASFVLWLHISGLSAAFPHFPIHGSFSRCKAHCSLSRKLVSCFPLVPISPTPFRVAAMLTRAWLKFVCALLLGFWLGLLLGFISSALLFWLMPAQWLENGFSDRKSRYDAFVTGKACKRAGWKESFYAETNHVEICACWPDGGMNSGAGTSAAMISCKGYERAGWSELGI
jgi:hypothetical protein